MLLELRLSEDSISSALITIFQPFATMLQFTLWSLTGDLQLRTTANENIAAITGRFARPPWAPVFAMAVGIVCVGGGEKMFPSAWRAGVKGCAMSTTPE
jgi:hypothetical protein